MKTNKMNRLLALLLALVLVGSLALSALADTVIGDLNGDGKVTVFDAQLLLESQAGLRQLNTDVKLLDIIKSILGGMPGAYDSDNDGVIEIYSAAGLKQITQNLNGSYKLMNDIDMQGANWIPLAKFAGKFDGNNKTISNVNIPYSATGLFSSKPQKINQGFFGDTAASSEIRDLNLKNVTITATEEARYIGLVVATSRGKVENVTATGTIIDNRTEYAENTYIGVLAGRIADSNVAVGNLIGGTSISVTDDAGKITTDGLCADVKLLIQNRDELNKVSGSYNKIGLVGYAPKEAEISGIWVETSNDTSILPEKVQANRANVIAYMNEMGSVKWTPVKDLAWVDSSNLTAKTYKAGTTYTGLPYTHCNGSLERFESILNEDGTVRSDIETGTYVPGEGYLGWVQYAGNNCSTAVGWAWMRVSSMFVAQQNSHTVPYHGGSYVVSTAVMIPSENLRNKYGIYPTGDWDEFNMIDPETGKKVEAPYDASKAAYVCTDEAYTGQVLQTNGLDTMLEAYAKARGGDAMVAYAEKWSATLGNAGHARLITADPIIIRDKNGVIDQDASYVITTEQGGGGVKNSTWRVYWKYTLRELLDDSADSASTGYWNTYIPITIRALHDDANRGSYTTISKTVTGPATGEVFSNYRIHSTTVTIKDGEEVVYQGEVFTGVGPVNSIYTGKHQTADLAGHQEGIDAAGLVAGQSYTFSVQVLTTDGKLHNTVTDQTFIAE